MAIVYYIMGVSGCGKSTLGINLAKALHIPFYDADDFHPNKNVQKMKEGIPLSDEDRVEWLQNIHAFVRNNAQSTSLVFACSALKEKYRQELSKDLDVRWVHLFGSFEEIESRMKQRTDHYMPASLLQSQFDALEEPEDAIEIPIAFTPAQQLDLLLKTINV